MFAFFYSQLYFHVVLLIKQNGRKEKFDKRLRPIKLKFDLLVVMICGKQRTSNVVFCVMTFFKNLVIKPRMTESCRPIRKKIVQVQILRKSVSIWTHFNEMRNENMQKL